MTRDLEHFWRRFRQVKRAFRAGGARDYPTMFRGLVTSLDAEIDRLIAYQQSLASSGERRLLKPSLVQLMSMKDDLLLRFNPKPPESGIPMPVEKPGGPPPSEGGAQAPLFSD